MNARHEELRVGSSAEDGWPYPDAPGEPEGDDGIDLDLFELRGDRVFAGLSASEQQVLFSRFGLAGRSPQSMKQLALGLSLTHSETRDLLGRAIDKVRFRLEGERPAQRRP